MVQGLILAVHHIFDGTPIRDITLSLFMTE